MEVLELVERSRREVIQDRQGTREVVAPGVDARRYHSRDTRAYGRSEPSSGVLDGEAVN